MRSFAALCVFSMTIWAQSPGRTIALTSLENLKPIHVKPDVSEFKGRRAIHAVAPGNDNGLVVLAENFQDGTLEVDLAGEPAAGSADGARGFIGLAFRVQPDNQHYECFYLRPTNGRADDQLRRNHSTQYTSEPDYPWFRLRKEFPGVYESYVDLQPGVWTHMKIVAAGKKAQLYVNGATEPCLIVNDMKGAASGAVALWFGVGTDGHFSNLRVTASK